uniref:Putative secreted protein n=1 Tax=Amblyomma cajennense TaxID=34607 RepID=A0A023FRU9_AMBCJ
MIFTLALCLGLLAAAGAASPQKRNESSEDLDIMKMVKVNETLVVLKRKHTRSTRYRCLTATKKDRISDARYKYTLRARRGKAIDNRYEAEDVEVTLEPLSRGSGYRSIYTDHLRINYTLTLRTMDPNGGCFVIFVEKSDGNKGCEVLVPLSRRDADIPNVCKRYYSFHCGGKSVKLHKADCNYEWLS